MAGLVIQLSWYVSCRDFSYHRGYFSDKIKEPLIEEVAGDLPATQHLQSQSQSQGKGRKRKFDPEDELSRSEQRPWLSSDPMDLSSPPGKSTRFASPPESPSDDPRHGSLSSSPVSGTRSPSPGPSSDDLPGVAPPPDDKLTSQGSTFANMLGKLNIPSLSSSSIGLGKEDSMTVHENIHGDQPQSANPGFQDFPDSEVDMYELPREELSLLNATDHKRRSSSTLRQPDSMRPTILPTSSTATAPISAPASERHPSPAHHDQPLFSSDED